MPEQYAYLIGTAGLAIIFSLLCYIRKDLRRSMIYSGLLYLLFMTAVFLFLKIITINPAKTINPGYWSPPSLLDLNNKTGGYGVEDILYMFFVGAIAAGLYDFVTKFKISQRQVKNLKKGHALLFSLIISTLVYSFTPMNTVDFFIIFQLLGAIFIIWQRRDLFLHSAIGGILLMVLYGIMFTIFRFLFPSFLANFYHLEKTSHAWIFGIPLEEYLYALTLGMMWAPIYEYEFRLKDRKWQRSGPRKLVPAAGATRR